VNLQARSVGGDYYDFIDTGDKRIGIALADVAGKGVPAAIIMSAIQASLRVITAEKGIALPEMAAKMNHFLYRSTGANSYATFFFGQLDEETRVLRYVNAGHNPPYLLRGAEIEELTVGGTVIGMFPRMAYQEGAVELQSGDVLIVFTDGVPEALNPAGEEFSEDKIKSLLRELAPLPVAEMSARFTQAMKDWIEDAEQYDDLTFLIVKVS
jgi:sigma-B regulation protein RsbU (phosphoserine phosphatase)